nr:cadherin-like beta sandwich domain-containing protein [Paenibacillus flagellatus]
MLQVGEWTGDWTRAIYSEEHTTAQNRPKLTVTYSYEPVTGVSVTPDSLSLVWGGSTGQLNANVHPTDASNKNIQWTSSNTAVATVDANGVVTPVAPGTAIITATTEDGNYSDTSTVTVSEPNANLSNLTLSQGTLAPGFDSATTSYTATVANSVYGLTVTPAVADATATVTVNGNVTASGMPSHSIPLNVGDNEVTVKVTALDGTEKTYKVTVTREAASSNADLSNLTLSQGTLTPTFLSGTTSYTATVTNSVYSLTVTATVYDPMATVTVNGTPVTSGTASQAIPLNVGSNKIEVTVTAEDGLTKKTYTVDVTRQDTASTSPENEGETDGNGSADTGNNSGSGGSTTPDHSADKPDTEKPETEKPSEQPGEAACTKLTWTDIQNHWAKSDIESASELCVVQGPSSDKFLPDDEVTRLQFALMVARAMKLQKSGEAAVLESFEDRNEIPGWAEAELAAAIRAGIIEGYEDETLRPNVKINRAEMVTMLIRGWKMSAAITATSFTDDADIPAWAKGFVAKAAQEGIIEGRSGNRFEPASTATRAEAVAVLVRILQDKP